MIRYAPAVLLCATPAFAQELTIPFQEFALDNGLSVVVHEDKSDPVVAVYLYYHVGSGREEPGRSGFAHLFEHMLFQGSEHVGDDQHFKLIQAAGGTLNGSTNTDRTNYFEVLPSNQLELALWLESDRMGFMLPAMTQAKLDNQRDVVKNERRQNYENRPYGQSEGAICGALYPSDHPYSWITIGSQADLTAATLEDVKHFFARWYGPNNATLAIGGDVKFDDVKKLVERYFGSLPPGPEVAKPTPRPAHLAESKRIVLEDQVMLPQLELVWPAVESDHADEAALDLLAAVLASNKWSVLDKALTIDQELARGVSAQDDAQELAGTFRVTLQANPGATLDQLEERTLALLEELDRKGVDEEALQRAKTVYEARFVRRLETVGMRTNLLAMSRCFQGDPAGYKATIARRNAVTTEDVRRVLREYVLHRPSLALSTVPAGKKNLAVSAVKPERKTRETARATETRTASALPATPKRSAAAAPAGLDRTRQPASGPRPAFRSPSVWHATMENGIAATGAAWSELPLTTFSIAVPAGRRYEPRSKLGLATLTAQMLNEGTRSLSTIELAEALDALGANLSVRADDDEITFSLSCLDRHLPAAVKLLSDVIQAPRLAQADFERLKKERLVAIDTRGDSITGIAGTVYRRLLYGSGRVQGAPALGTKATVSALTLDDVREHWRSHVQPRGARLVHVGGRGAQGVKELFLPLTSTWKASSTIEASARREPEPPQVFGTKLYLVDKPGAAQSEIRIGHLGITANDPGYYRLSIANYGLGGSFSSRINLNLREDKGYTYGARSSVEAALERGAFTASAPVKTDVTKESVVELMKELAGIAKGLTESELHFVKDAVTQAAATQYESTRALLDYVENVSRLGWPDDYQARRLAEFARFTPEITAATARTWIHPEQSVILVVGDKARILKGLSELPYGAPIELDLDGEPVSPTVPALPILPTKP
ncbi:MAG: insulinase family protein [Planctomycetes bacterium]|nr:insulinase family protein [Planctomycetota bacterium]